MKKENTTPWKDIKIFKEFLKILLQLNHRLKIFFKFFFQGVENKIPPEVARSLACSDWLIACRKI